MDNFSYCSPTRYLFGRGTEDETGRLVAEAGWKTVMIVYGGGSAVRSGLLGRVCDSLSRRGITFVTFGGIHPTPPTRPCATASRCAACRVLRHCWPWAAALS